MSTKETDHNGKKEENSICLKKQQPFSLPRFSFHFNIAFPPPLFHLILIFLQSSSTRPSSAGERGIRGEEPQDTAKGKRALRILQLTVSSRPTHLHRLCERRMAYQDLQPLAPAYKKNGEVFSQYIFRILGLEWVIRVLFNFMRIST